MVKMHEKNEYLQLNISKHKMQTQSFCDGLRKQKAFT
jgi:hypothetical protein